MRWADDQPAAGTLHRYAVGAAITRQGDRVESLSLVLEGRVACSCLAIDGREAIVGLLGEGDLIGVEGVCEVVGSSAVATATALEPTLVRAFPVDVARATMGRDPGFCLRVATAIATQHTEMTRSLADVLTLELDDRLASMVASLARRHGVDDGHGLLLPRWLTQERVGRCIGATRESVNRSLGRLSARGVVRVTRGRVTVLDVAARRISA